MQTKVGAAAGTFYYTYTDHLGNITALSWTGGTFTTTTPTSNPSISNHGFTGHRHNNTGTNNLGLIYMNARYYLPEVGRFISADTIVPDPSNPQSFNRYSYTRNNPVNLTDPTGHRECIDDLCDIVVNEQTNRPAMRGPVPTAISYIHQEMVRNGASWTANLIRAGNRMPLPQYGKPVAYGIWTAQVMDAGIKDYAGPLSPYLANWDHKPILQDDNGPVPEIAETNWATIGNRQYRGDVWSNIHYGYVGAATGFSELELINGAGLEQIGTNLMNRDRPTSSIGAPTFLSSWDQPSDTASIQLGAMLWQQYGLAVSPADLYLGILETPGLASR